MTIIIFLLVLAVLIFVHELGHFLAARAFGIRVDAFALGFGPKLLSWTRGETKYGINLIPFGGYVKIFGENPDEESMHGPDSMRSFVNKPKWQQVIVLAAGVIFNFIFAWILYAVVFTSGVTATPDGFEKYANRFDNQRVMITFVSPNSPAEKAGIMMGDVITGVSDSKAGNTINSSHTANQDEIKDIQNVINSSGGNILDISYKRGALTKTVQITPEKGLVENKYAIGIAMQSVGDLRLPFLTSIWEGLKYTGMMIRDTIVGLYTFFMNIIGGTANFSDVAGPVGIAGIVGNAAQLGFTYLVMITALISINLGVINFIPFPALDGGRILFVIIEAIIRRRISPTFTNWVNGIGFALLMILMITITYKDVVKLIK